jgi:hypothetical protein
MNLSLFQSSKFRKALHAYRCCNELLQSIVTRAWQCLPSCWNVPERYIQPNKFQNMIKPIQLKPTKQKISITSILGDTLPGFSANKKKSQLPCSGSGESLSTLHSSILLTTPNLSCLGQRRNLPPSPSASLTIALFTKFHRRLTCNIALLQLHQTQNLQTMASSFSIPHLSPVRIRSAVLRIPLATKIILLAIVVFWFLGFAFGSQDWARLDPTKVFGGGGTLFPLQDRLLCRDHKLMKGYSASTINVSFCSLEHLSYGNKSHRVDSSTRKV